MNNKTVYFLALLVATAASIASCTVEVSGGTKPNTTTYHTEFGELKCGYQAIDYCGVRLQQCEDGKEYYCLVNVIRQ
jgi:hypothetical protein